MPAMLDRLLPRLSPDSSSSRANFRRFLNALNARFSSSSDAKMSSFAGPAPARPGSKVVQTDPGSKPTGRSRRSGEEAGDRLAEPPAVLDVRQVAHPRQDDHLGHGDGLGQRPGDPGRVHDVELTDEDERRDADRPEAVAGVVRDAGAGLAGERLGLLRPGIPLGES